MPMFIGYLIPISRDKLCIRLCSRAISSREKPVVVTGNASSLLIYYSFRFDKIKEV